MKLNCKTIIAFGLLCIHPYCLHAQTQHPAKNAVNNSITIEI